MQLLFLTKKFWGKEEMDFDWDVVETSVRNLRREGLRTFLTLIGVIIGIAAIVSLLSIGDGLRETVSERFESLGTNSVIIIPGASSMALAPIKLTQIDLSNIDNTSGVESSTPVYSKNAVMEYNEEKINITINAVNPKTAIPILESTGFLELEEGRMIQKNDSEGVLIGTRLAKTSFKKEILPRKQVRINGVSYNVAGTLKPQSNMMAGGDWGSAVYMSIEALKKIFPFDSLAPSVVFVKTFSAEDAREVTDSLTDYFDKKYGKKSVSVNSTEDLLNNVNMVLDIITIFITGIGAISLLVGGIGIMNAMVTSVMERTREIGLLKALGASDKKIRNIFLLEAALIGGIGGVLGVITGYLMSYSISFIGHSIGFKIKAAFGWEVTIGALIFAMIVGCISGVLPAINAAKLDPVTALRYE